MAHGDLTEYPELLTQLDAWFREGLDQAGPSVVPCSAGCSACCNGPFDISPADAALVARGVRALSPGTRAGVLLRAEAQLTRYAEFAPFWGPPWDVAALGEEAFDQLSEALADLPCPALDSQGICSIYEYRPATCRLMGLAAVTPDGDVLENACPIQSGFPGYAALPPTPFDLLRFELQAEEVDRTVAAKGGFSTTVAGALLLRV
ncbi:MAG: YkgJ family cysteine cluster protein [Gemmatimonadota bacterium]